MSRIIYLFLSSPGDCDQERELARSVVTRINSDPAFRRDGIQIVIEESVGVPYSSANAPQLDVDTYRKRPDECAIFVCIFRNRFGSPPEKTLAKPDGQPCQSGTEYEFCVALEQTTITPRLPHMLTYRYIGSVDPGTDAGHLQKIETFFSGGPFVDNQGRCTGGYHTYIDFDEFEGIVEQHLREYMFRDDWFDDWMTRQCDRFVMDAGPRYTKAAHVETDIMQSFDWLLRTEIAFRELDNKLSTVYTSVPFNDPQLQDLKSEFDKLAQRFRKIQVWRDGFPIDECNALFLKVQEKVESALEKQREVFDLLRQVEENEKPSDCLPDREH